MQRFVGSKISVPVFFSIISILAYGLLLPFTGFYWDDWPFAWIAKFLGPAEFIPAFLTFRPFLGPIFLLTTSVIPPSPIYWQVFALVIRVLIGLSCWWMMRRAWPERPRAAVSTGLLMLVFPGYSQHWIAFTHINQELIPFIFYLLSLGFTATAIRRDRPFVPTLVALLLQVCGLFSTEYYLGMEVVRLALILAILPEEPLRPRLLRTFRLWLPYGLLWMINLAWLLYYYRYGPYVSYEVTVAQAPSLLGILLDLGDSLWKVGFYVWAQILILLGRSGLSPTTFLTIGLILVVFVALWRQMLPGGDVERTPRNFAWALIGIGLAGILAGRVPSLAAGLPLRLQSSYDRFMVSMMLGGCLFIVGILHLAFRTARGRDLALAVLVALGTGQQFFNANIFRRDWQKQAEIFWQMAWRMPGLQPGTLLLTHQMPIDYETDLSFTAPINWMYAPDFNSGDLPYALLYTEKRLGGPTLPSLDLNLPVSIPYRTVTFRGSTSQVVVIHMPANGCLRVLDPARGDERTYGREPAGFVEAIRLSNPGLILASPERNAEPPFFSEPEHTWCYYYTRAELARQTGAWTAVERLGADAARAGFRPEDSIEWLPFIEAYARVGKWAEATQLARQAFTDQPRVRTGLCEIWRRTPTSAGADPTAEADLSSLLRELNCAS